MHICLNCIYIYTWTTRNVVQYVNKGVFKKHCSYTSPKYWKTIQQPFCENVDSILHLDLLTYDNNHNNNNTAKNKAQWIIFYYAVIFKDIKVKR